MKQEDRNICLPVPRVIDGWPWIVFNTDGEIKFVAMLRAFGPSLRSRRLSKLRFNCTPPITGSVSF